MVVRDALLMPSWGETMGLLYNVKCKKSVCALCDMCYLYPQGVLYIVCSPVHHLLGRVCICASWEC